MYSHAVRADRLLALLMRLQLRGRATARELARDLEVSVRTVHRDIEALGQAGIPVVADRGRQGGFSLMKGYRTQLTGLSEKEVQSLPFLGLEAAAALGLDRSAEAAWLKVLAALPSQSSGRVRGIRERFHVDPVGWYERIATPTHLRAIAAATWAGQVLRLDYESWKSRTWRTVHPLGLVLKAGRWYLLSTRPGGGRLSILQVASVHAVEVLPDRFRVPTGFDLAHSWRAEVARFEASLKQLRASVRIAPAALSRVDRLGGENADAIRVAAVGSDGWREAEIWIEGIAHAASVLLGFGTDVEVLAPQALRDEVASRAAGVHALYRERRSRRR
jgi:predicted DNA-binding transcriptional regulator YafY